MLSKASQQRTLGRKWIYIRPVKLNSQVKEHIKHLFEQKKVNKAMYLLRSQIHLQHKLHKGKTSP